MDADANADTDAMVTAIALPVPTYRRAKKEPEYCVVWDPSKVQAQWLNRPREVAPLVIYCVYEQKRIWWTLLL